jgi:hypothetical protein
VPLCEKTCTTDADCTSLGGKCLDSVSGTAPYNLCTVGCSLLNDKPCPAGDVCRFAGTSGGEPMTYCGGKGAGGQDDPCVDAGDCGDHMFCYQGTCEQLCDANINNCPFFYSCYSFGLPTIQGYDIGTCEF